MLSDKIDMNKFSSITVLKHSNSTSTSIHQKHLKVNELDINSYYGMALQKILFPDVKVEEINTNTLLVEDTFFTKMTNKFKR